MLRNHAGALAGVIVALTLTLLAVGCQPTTNSTLQPGKKIDAAGLTMEAAEVQQTLDAEASAIEKQTADYNSRIKSANAKLTAAGNDLAAKENMRRQLVSAVGGVIPALLSGQAMNPTTYTSAFLTLLGIAGGAGALVDSSKKSGVISRLRSSQPADAGATDSATAGGALPSPIAAAGVPVTKG